jgi:hypothetical protein
VAKVFSGMLLAGGVLFIVSAVVLARSVRSLDLQIFDVYFVVLPRYLFFLALGLFLGAFIIWKAVVAH